MKIEKRAERDAKAQARLVAAAEYLATHLGIDIPEGIRVQRGRPPERMMWQREAVADLLEAIQRKVADAKAEPRSWVASVAESIVLAPWFTFVPESIIVALRDAGFADLESIDAASDEELLAVHGIGPATLRRMRGED